MDSIVPGKLGDILAHRGAPIDRREVVGILGEPKGVKASAMRFGSQETFGTTANLNKRNLGVRIARNRNAVRRGFSLGPSARFARSRILGYSPRPRARKALTKARGLSREGIY